MTNWLLLLFLGFAQQQVPNDNLVTPPTEAEQGAGEESSSAAEPLPPLPQNEARLIPLAELANAADEAKVAVLFPCERADASTASRTVLQSFEIRSVSMQPDQRANAIFISGEAWRVREAVTRLRALDELTPERPEPPARRAGPPSNLGETEALEVAEGYAADAEATASMAGFAIAGLIGLALAAVLLVRRMTG